MFTQSLLTPEQHINWLNNYVYKGKCYQYIITVILCGKSYDIGTIFLKNIDKGNNKAEYGIFIGEQNFCGKGYAKLASELILKIAFEELLLNRVYLSVMFDNMAAIKTYKKVGFVQEGILKEDFFRENKFIDILIMGITKKMWEQKKSY